MVHKIPRVPLAADSAFEVKKKSKFKSKTLETHKNPSARQKEHSEIKDVNAGKLGNRNAKKP